MHEKITKLLVEFNSLDRVKTPILLRDFTISKSDDTVTNFLFNFFTNYNKNFVTRDENYQFITGVEKRRSVNELYDLVKFYFPDCDEIEYFKSIYHAAARIWTETDSMIFVHWCPNINRHVIYFCNKAVNNEYLDKNHKYFVSPDNKFFPINFFWTYTTYYSSFWKLFYDEEVTFELVGNVYEKLADK